MPLWYLKLSSIWSIDCRKFLCGMCATKWPYCVQNFFPSSQRTLDFLYKLFRKRTIGLSIQSWNWWKDEIAQLRVLNKNTKMHHFQTSSKALEHSLNFRALRSFMIKWKPWKPTLSKSFDHQWVLVEFRGKTSSLNSHKPAVVAKLRHHYAILHEHEIFDTQSQDSKTQLGGWKFVQF